MTRHCPTCAVYWSGIDWFCWVCGDLGWVKLPPAFVNGHTHLPYDAEVAEMPLEPIVLVAGV